MPHLPFTLSAYFFNALSILASKALLNKTIPDPLIYVFFISLISLLAVFTLPFTNIPSLEVFSSASLSTLLWTLGAYFMFKALKIGPVSRVIPIIGTVVPLILLSFASQTNAITTTQTWAILVLVLGMVFLSISDWQLNLKLREFLFEILSAISFALSYIILRQTLLKFDFFSVLVWSRLILLPLGLLILAVPAWRRKIITSSLSLSLRRPGSINFLSKAGLIFIGGQLSGTISEFLLLFSISLANPALVNSLQGTQYIFLLIFERQSRPPKVLLSKIAGILLIGIGLYLLRVN